MTKLAFTGCTHLGHKNILRYDNRPFSNIWEHDKTLIQNWNSVCDENTTVFHLGDVMLGNYRHLTNIFNELKFKELFVLPGNHESDFTKWFEREYPSRAVNKAIYFLPAYYEFTYQPLKQLFILMHYPILSWNRKHHGAIMLHSHCHNNLIATRPESNLLGKIMDVGVVGHNYTPWTVEEVVDIMGKKDMFAKSEIFNR